MTKNDTIRYYVEGECEKRLIEVLKSDFRLIRPGKVEVFNPITHRFTSARLMLISPNTTVVMVFDTDVKKTEVFDENLHMLRRSSRVSDVITVLQVKNFEDEIIRCCKINNVTQLFGSKSKKDFKTDFINTTNLKRTLINKGFNIDQLWNQNDSENYLELRNGGTRIKL